MSLEDFILEQLNNTKSDLSKPKNWDDEILRNYLLGWKDALEVIQNEMGKRV